MQLKVILPSGEVNITVEANSTPGHLKENLKYSLRVPPKHIRLTCDGRDLDDLKALNADPNNVVEGATVVAMADESAAPLQEAFQKEASAKAAQQPAIIKKEEPPKPKKPKKDVSRPILTDKDVVKKQTLSPGHMGWAPKGLEGKSSKRQIAYLKVEAVDEKKVYPEQEDGQMVIALGDPQTSPAWTAAVIQMEIGEKAIFAMTQKAIDFDPEGLTPTDGSATWNIELLRVIEVTDVLEDFSQLLHIETSGKAERAEDLDRVAVHWRMRRWMAEGTFCVASSRERMAILPGYGIVPIEDQNAPPVGVSIGEGQQEAVELIASRLGCGGVGHLYLKTEALKRNRPAGCVVIDVELQALDPCRGPGSEGWQGWKSVVAEREHGDQWLEEGDSRRKQLETFGTLRKSTGDSKDAEQKVADEVHRMASNASRRYRRLLRWLEQDDQSSKQIKSELNVVKMRLAKAQVLSHMRFGENPGAPSEAEVAAVKEARELLKDVHDKAEENKEEKLQYECLKMTLQVCIQAEDVEEARKVLEKLQKMRPDDDELRNDGARLNRLATEKSLEQGASGMEGVQKDLQTAVTNADKDAVKSALEKLDAMFKACEVKYDDVKRLKVGKDVGNAMKMGDPDIAGQARKVVGEIQKLAQKADLGV